MQSPQRDDLVRYQQSGHIVLRGRLGTRPAFVVITPYAQRRMRERDVDEDEVIAAIALPRDFHSVGKTPQRQEVAGDTGRGTLRLVYERPSPDVVVVVTLYPEY